MVLLRAEEAGLAAAQAVHAAAAEEELKELKALRHVRDAVMPPPSPPAPCTATSPYRRTASLCLLTCCVRVIGGAKAASRFAGRGCGASPRCVRCCRGRHNGEAR